MDYVLWAVSYVLGLDPKWVVLCVCLSSQTYTVATLSPRSPPFPTRFNSQKKCKYHLGGSY